MTKKTNQFNYNDMHHNKFIYPYDDPKVFFIVPGDLEH